MKISSTKKLVVSALFTALTFVATYIYIPLAVGNINLGDAFILIGAYMLGAYAIIACPLGASLCDLISGYTIYAPATFVIKALMVVCVILVLKLFNKINKGQKLALVISAILAEIIMVLGYLVYELFLYGGSAFANVPFNLIQAVINVVIATILFILLTKLKIFENYVDK